MHRHVIRIFVHAQKPIIGIFPQYHDQGCVYLLLLFGRALVDVVEEMFPSTELRRHVHTRKVSFEQFRQKVRPSVPLSHHRDGLYLM